MYLCWEKAFEMWNESVNFTQDSVLGSPVFNASSDSEKYDETLSVDLHLNYMQYILENLKCHPISCTCQLQEEKLLFI